MNTNDTKKIFMISRRSCLFTKFPFETVSVSMLCWFYHDNHHKTLPASVLVHGATPAESPSKPPKVGSKELRVHVTGLKKAKICQDPQVHNSRNYHGHNVHCSVKLWL